MVETGKILPALLLVVIVSAQIRIKPLQILYEFERVFIIPLLLRKQPISVRLYSAI